MADTTLPHDHPRLKPGSTVVVKVAECDHPDTIFDDLGDIVRDAPACMIWRNDRDCDGCLGGGVRLDLPPIRRALDYRGDV